MTLEDYTTNIALGFAEITDITNERVYNSLAIIFDVIARKKIRRILSISREKARNNSYPLKLDTDTKSRTQSAIFAFQIGCIDCVFDLVAIIGIDEYMPVSKTSAQFQ